MTRALLSMLATWISALMSVGLMAALMGGAILFKYAADLPAPPDLLAYRPPVISHLVNRNGEVIARFGEERRIFLSFEEIPLPMVQAVLAAEDRNFFEHEGFDLRAMAIALYEAVVSRGQNVRGASTITQQVVKNFILTPERTLDRKLQEILLAQRIEQFLSKERILELYLNEIFLGQNSYGVAAAALTYFGRPLEDLDWHEYAYLASLPQAPSRLHPVRDQARAVARRNFVLEQLGRMEALTPEQVRSYSARPLETVQSGAFASHWARVPARDHIVEEAQRQAVRRFGEDSLARDGITMHVGIDPDMQRATAVMYRSALVRYDRQSGLWRGPYLRVDVEGRSEDDLRRVLEASSVPRDIPEWTVGLVLSVSSSGAEIGFVSEEGVWSRAQVGGQDVRVWRTYVRPDGSRRAIRNPSEMLAPGDILPFVLTASGDSFRAVPQQIPEIQGGFLAADVSTGRVLVMHGGFSFEASNFNRATQAMRQTGSSFKTFVYAYAFERGLHPATILNDTPLALRVYRNQVWQPRNASGRFYGPVSARHALERSFNVSTVGMAWDLGLDGLYTLAERMGVYPRMNRFPANILGAQETTLWNMVQSYGIFATGGRRFTLSLFDRVQDRDGGWLYRADQRICVDCDNEELVLDGIPFLLDPPRPRVIDPVVAYQITSVLEGAVERGTGRAARIPGVQVAGKTGTTNDLRDVWFVGYTPNVVAGCYLGFDTPRSLGQGSSGGSLCAPVFQEIVAHIEAGLGRPGRRFEIPPEGEFVTFDRRTGRPLRPGQSSRDVVVEFMPRTSQGGLGSDPLNFLDAQDARDLEDRLMMGLERLDVPENDVWTGGLGPVPLPDDVFILPQAPQGGTSLSNGSNYRWNTDPADGPIFVPETPVAPLRLDGVTIHGLY